MFETSYHASPETSPWAASTPHQGLPPQEAAQIWPRCSSEAPHYFIPRICNTPLYTLLDVCLSHNPRCSPLCGAGALRSPPGLFSSQPLTLPSLERAFAHLHPPLQQLLSDLSSSLCFPSQVCFPQCLQASQLSIPSTFSGQTKSHLYRPHCLGNTEFPQLWKAVSSSSQ